jgi:hypothetical protein
MNMLATVTLAAATLADLARARLDANRCNMYLPKGQELVLDKRRIQ